MPVDRRRHREPVRDVDPDPLTLHRLDDGAVDAAVVAPALRPQAGVKRMVHFTGNQMEDLHPVHHIEWKCGAIRDHDRLVVLARQPGWQRHDIDRPSAIGLRPIGATCG
jgi:hypothetical protein